MVEQVALNIRQRRLIVVDIACHALKLVLGVPGIIAVSLRRNNQKTNLHIALAQGDAVPMVRMLHVEQFLHLPQDFIAIRFRTEQHSRLIHPFRSLVLLKLMK